MKTIASLYAAIETERDELLELVDAGAVFASPEDLIAREIEYMTSLLYALAARAKYEGAELQLSHKRGASIAQGR